MFSIISLSASASSRASPDAAIREPGIIRRAGGTAKLATPPVVNSLHRRHLFLLPYRLDALDPVTRADAALGEPALAHFERVKTGAARPVRVLGLRGHVLDVEDRAVRIEERDR